MLQKLEDFSKDKSFCCQFSQAIKYWMGKICSKYECLYSAKTTNEKKIIYSGNMYITESMQKINTSSYNILPYCNHILQKSEFTMTSFFNKQRTHIEVKICY